MAQTVILNQQVEVFGDAEEGFPGCWFPGYSLGLVGKLKARIEYAEFVDEGTGLPLIETIPLTRVRPPPPPKLAHFASFKEVKVGLLVEAYFDDCWWYGIVSCIRPAGVNLRMHESGGDELFVRDPRLLRPRMELVKGSWRHAVPKRKALKDCGIDTKTADAAIKAMEAVPSVPMGSPSVRFTSAGGIAAAATQHQLNQASKSLVSPLHKQQGAGGAVATGAGPSAAGPSAGTKRGRAPEPAEGGRSKRPRQQDAGSVHGSPEEATSEDEGEEVDSEEERGAGPSAAPLGTRRPNTAQAGGAAAPTSRPRREDKNRIIYVRGVPVLKENMYGLHDEDTMKWQRALKTGQASLEGVVLNPRQQQKAPAAKPTRQKAEKPAREQAAEVLARLKHNNDIKSASQAAEVQRARYLIKHMDKIRPFIAPQVEANLRAVARGAAAQAAAPVTQQPLEILATLREYQLEGLDWLVAQWDRGVNAILADEMGLGKTLQTITFLAHLKFVRQVQGPHLVVVPLSVLSSWMSEFRKWCPSMRVVRLHCVDPEERKRLVREVLSDPASFDVAVTTYEMVNSQHFGHSLKHHIVWRYLVLDEGHKVKNEETLVSHGMRHISRQQVLMLTGTPIQNNLHELFALLNFMYPDVFMDASRFDEAFNLSKHKVDAQGLEAAHYLLRPFMLRRLKEEVEGSLPPKLETRIHCPLAPMQTFWYRRLLLRDSSLLAGMEKEDEQATKLVAKRQAGGHTDPSSSAATASGELASECGGNWKSMMNLLMQLRKVCNHPFMFPDSEPDFDGESVPEELVTGSGKMMVLDRMLARLKERGHRVVLFSQFNLMLDIIEDYLVDRGINYRRMDGSTNRIQRMIDMEQFNKPNSDVFIYILCTRAGGLGVNLQTADTCILFDSDWNPQWDLQAMARVHRIGQTRPVHVYRLVTGDTVEDRIQRRAEAKLYLDQMVNRGSTSNGEQLEGLTKSEVLSMLRFGADRIFRNEQGAIPSDAELDAIMDRSCMVADAAAAREAAAGAAAPATAGAGSAGGGGGPSQAVAAGAAAASGSAAAGGSGAGAGLVEHKHSALAFDAEAPPTETFMFQGMDFRALRAAGSSLRDISAAFWAGQKRERRERLIDVDGYQVLRDNNYTMEEGMLHHDGQQRGKLQTKPRTTQRAGVDYQHMDHCLVCWDGGDLLCCDHCPGAFHASCLGISAKLARELSKRNWSCPHHSCVTCERSTGKAGGLLFRCEMCSNAYCEDDLPAEHHMVGECELFKALGQRHPKQACFIHCSDRCKELSQDMQPRIQEAMASAAAAEAGWAPSPPAAGPSSKAAVNASCKGGAAGTKR